MTLLAERLGELNRSEQAIDNEEFDPTSRAAKARAAFERSADDPKRIADLARWEAEKRKAAEWARVNYGHNDRLNESLLRTLHATFPVAPGFALPEPQRRPQTVAYPPLGRYDVAERKVEEALRRKQERRRKLLDPIVTIFERVRRKQPRPARA